jgi:hypothetical protein
MFIEITYQIFKEFHQVDLELLSSRLLIFLSKIAWPANPCG